MKKINWNYPTTIWLGENRIQELNIACQNLNIKRPLFVTDKDLFELNIVKDVLKNLSKTYKDINFFSNFTGNPTGDNVEEGVKTYNSNNCDGVIAFGGGRVLMLGKL